MSNKPVIKQEALVGELKHTALPWRVETTKRGTKNVFYICNKGKNVVDAGYVYGNDAEFIVKACNSHYELLEACKEALDHFDRMEHKRPIAETLRQAIAKAEANDYKFTENGELD